MAEISIVTTETRSQRRPRPPLVASPLPAGDLYTFLNIPRYAPPQPSTRFPRPSTQRLTPHIPSPSVQQLHLHPTPTQRMPTIQEFFAENPGLPHHAALLGINEDDLPVLMDINDPGPGALLVVGDERQQQIDLLRVAVSSLILRNSPRNVQFIVLSHLPEAWQDWVSKHGYERYCLGVFRAEDEKTREWIQTLSEWVEERQQGKRGGPPILILLDTLSFLPKMEYDLRVKFETIAKEGPQQRIWPFGAISVALANSLIRQIRIFSTIIYGYTEDLNFYVKVGGQDVQVAKNFGKPGQFAVKVNAADGQTWLRFRLPTLE